MYLQKYPLLFNSISLVTKLGLKIHILNLRLKSTASNLMCVFNLKSSQQPSGTTSLKKVFYNEALSQISLDYLTRYLNKNVNFFFSKYYFNCSFHSICHFLDTLGKCCLMLQTKDNSSGDLKTRMINMILIQRYITCENIKIHKRKIER